MLVKSVGYLVSLLLATCYPLQLSLGQDSSLAVASYLESVALNARSLQQVDVLIESSSFTLLPDGNTEERALRERLMVDRPADLCFYTSMGEMSIVEESSLQDQRSAGIVAGMKTPATGFIRQLPRSTESIGVGSIQEVLAHVSAPELRLVGLAAFPVPTMDEELTQSLLATASTPVPGARLTSSGDKDVTLHVDYDKGGYQNRMVWSMQLANNMPRSVRNITVSERGGNQELKQRYVETYEWELLENVYVPTAIAGERRRPWKRTEQGTIFVVETYDVRFQWLSVNKPLPEEFFKESLLSDPQRLRELINVDPKSIER